MRDTTFTTSTGYDANDATAENIRAFLNANVLTAFDGADQTDITTNAITIPCNCCCDSKVVAEEQKLEALRTQARLDVKIRAWIDGTNGTALDVDCSTGTTEWAAAIFCNA